MSGDLKLVKSNPNRKVPRRITAVQFEEGVMQRIKSIRGKVAENSVSNALSFTLLVYRDLYGEREFQPVFKEFIAEVFAAAKAERAEAELAAREAAKKAREDKPRIIVP